MLSIVATPIGNLKDITLRALEVLKEADLIACEDTRHTKILLDRYSITTPTTSFFQHNRMVKGEYLLGLLREGKHIALVSDAGMPGILDPGYNLINAAIREGIQVTVVPGATALINALVVSGKPAHSFFFDGFLPPKQAARQKRIRLLLEMGCTVILYESCHRILKTLADFDACAPERQIVCVREITKKFEEVSRGTPAELLSSFSQRAPRGEFVLVL
jgi:16S rRNA (cytidine1402-2'-O)-methyltransferase